MKSSVKRRGAIGTAVVVSAVAAVIVIAAVGYFVFAGMSKSPTTTPITTTSAPKTVSVTMPAGVSTDTSLNFQPAAITLFIGVNNSVTWTNDDGAPHTVTSTSVPSGASAFSSGNMNSGATFSYTFTVPGTYSYDCIYHTQWMKGTIVVKQG